MERYNTTLAGGYMQIPVCDKTVSTDLSGDFTLPDYQPEIKKLLRVTASVLPPSKYIGNGEAEFTGNIDYYVLYMGSDNGIYCAPLTADYKIDVGVGKVRYALKPHKVFLFSKKDEQRLYFEVVV